MIAIFLAIAIFAFFRPIRLTSRRPQACSGDHRLVRWMRTVAASNRYDRRSLPPHLEMRPVRSSSPDCFRRGVSPR
jgi:hypothetical protein